MTMVIEQRYLQPGVKTMAAGAEPRESPSVGFIDKMKIHNNDDYTMYMVHGRVMGLFGLLLGSGLPLSWRSLNQMTTSRVIVLIV